MTDRTKKMLRDFGILIAALLGALGWAIRSSAQYVDDRYVHAADYQAHLAGEAALHVRDSLNQSSDFRELRAVLFGLDSSDRCRRGFREYCR